MKIKRMTETVNVTHNLKLAALSKDNDYICVCMVVLHLNCFWFGKCGSILTVQNTILHCSCFKNSGIRTTETICIWEANSHSLNVGIHMSI